MDRKFLQNNWNEMRGQISEWWDDLTDKDLDMIDGNQEQLITVLQEHYGYTRNLAFLEVKIRMASYRPEGEGKEKNSSKDLGVLQYSSYESDDCPKANNGRGFSGSGVKVRTQGFANQYNNQFLNTLRKAILAQDKIIILKKGDLR